MDKICAKCKVQKEFKDFDFRNDTKNYRPYCKECRKKKDLQYNIKIGKNKGIFKNNKKLKLQNLKHCKRCKTTQSRNNFHNSNNKPDGKMSHCKICRSKIAKSKIVREIRLKYYNTNTLYKLKCILRSRTYSAFKYKGYSKNSKTKEILGIEWEVCKNYIERQFTKGMNWDNQGQWHIDHIIPLASAKTPKELKKLCHYTNLQPLWAADNLSKSDSINGQQILLRI